MDNNKPLKGILKPAPIVCLQRDERLLKTKQPRKTTDKRAVQIIHANINAKHRKNLDKLTANIKSWSNIRICTQDEPSTNLPLSDSLPKTVKKARSQTPKFASKPKPIVQAKARSSKACDKKQETKPLCQNDPALVVDQINFNTAASKPKKLLWDKEKPRPWEPYLNNQYDKTFVEPPNEVNFIDGLGAKVGNPRSKVFIQRPTQIQGIYNMRTRNRPLSGFTDDITVAHCSIGKQRKLKQKDIVIKSRPIKNVVFNRDNPLNLDFQGFNWMETLQRDKQDEQNKREYFKQKSDFDKREFNAQMKIKIADERRQERFGLPTAFKLEEQVKEPPQPCNVIDQRIPKLERPEPEAIPYVQESKIQSQLLRTMDKEKNIEIQNQKFQNRQERITEQLERKHAKETKLYKEKQKNAAEEKTTLMHELGVEDYKEVENAADKILEKFKKLPTVYRSKNYPHTMRELEYMKRVIAEKNRSLKEYATQKTKFYEEIECPKTFKLKDIEITDTRSDAVELSEQSTDDEDGLSVGPKPNRQYQLRGFHSKAGGEPRGRVGAKSKIDRAPLTCITRDEWLDIMAPKSKPPIIFKNCPSTVIPTAVPTDNDYSILEHPKYAPAPIENSPVAEMIMNVPLLKQTTSDTKIKVTKPKEVKIKKFNLTGYLYGTVKRDKQVEIRKSIARKGLNKIGVPFETVDRCNADYDKRQLEIKKVNNMRLRAIGIDMNSSDSDVVDSKSDDSESSSNFDWVPEKMENHRENQMSPSRGNPSKSDELSCVPRLLKTDSNIIIQPNLQLEKTEHTKLLEVRHHHDHLDHTQHKTILVDYMPKIPEFAPTAEQRVSDVIPQTVDPFQFKIPMTVAVSEIHSRNPENLLETTNKSKYKQFIHDKLTEFQHSTGTFNTNICVIDPVLRQEFCQELESIASCCSSDTSSNGTNFTNDSGSFFIIQGTKVPLDFLTKSQIPFEEVDRNRLKATDIGAQVDNISNPYYRVPFCGQKQVMREIAKPKDKFFTSTCRSRFGIRKRLMVPVPEFNEEYMGTPENKFVSTLITEWDEYYQHEIKNRPRIKAFKRTQMQSTRSSLRKKFVSFFIREYLTKLKMRQHYLEMHFEQFFEFRALCEVLFRSWKEKHNQRAMWKQNELEPMFDGTQKMLRSLDQLRKQMIKTVSRIMFLEDVWIRRTMYQNFQYLVMEPEWRYKFDWIHRDVETGGQESFSKSFAERRYKNVRFRDKDDAWAVKDFYENVYEISIKSHEMLFPFQNTNEFRFEIIKLKLRLYMSLVDLHFKMMILTNVEKDYNDFVKWSRNYLEQRDKYVKDRCTKKYFVEDRAKYLEDAGKQIIQDDLTESVSCSKMRRVNALCECVYAHFRPQGTSAELNLTILDKFEIISDLVVKTLGKIDKIPKKIFQESELSVRFRHDTEIRQAHRALNTENGVKFVMTGLMRSMQPKFKKPKRVGKLPRSRLPKRKPTPPVPKPPLSPRVKLFYEAFTDDHHGDVDVNNEENLNIMNSLQSSCIPFYFDHFLKMHEYVPVYDFQTVVELRDGPEENRFMFKDVLPEVNAAMQRWTRYKKIEEEHFIRKAWYLYIDKDEDE